MKLVYKDKIKGKHIECLIGTRILDSDGNDYKLTGITIPDPVDEYGPPTIELDGHIFTDMPEIFGLRFTE